MSRFITDPMCRLALVGSMLLVPIALHGQHIIEEVRVIGTPRSTSPTDLAQSVTVLQDERLSRAQNTNLGETLADELGVTASAFGAGSSRPIIRGLAGARVRTLEDGIDSLDIASVSGDHAVSIDPLVAEQIEIFRGPTTLLYGSGAVGGVINTVTRRIPEAAPENGFEGAFELRGNTVADERTGALRLDGGSDQWAWHFDALSRDTSDYEIPEFIEASPEEGLHAPGVLPNSDLEASSVALGGTWLGENTSLGVSISGFGTQYGIPSHDEGNDGQGGVEESVRIDLDQTRFDLKGSWLGVSESLEAINLRVGINDYEHVELEGTEIGTVFRNDAYETRLEFLHTPWGSWEGAFGLQFGERRFSASGEEAFVPPVDTRNVGLFIIERRELEDWDLSIGNRIEAQTHKPSSGLPDISETAFSMSLAGIRQLENDYSIALNFALAQRMPTAAELYSDGPHLATTSFEIGNPNLTEETSRQVDIGVRKTAGTTTWSITGFFTSFDDFIFLHSMGMADPESELPIHAFGQDDADIFGIEAEVFSPLASVGQGELDLRVYTDYVEGELSSGEYIPRLPPWRYGVRLEYHDESFRIGIEATRYDKQHKTGAFEQSTSGYTMLKTDFSWSLPTGEAKPELDLFLKGSNLLDEDARRHTSLVKEIAPLPGRNFSLGLRAIF